MSDTNAAPSAPIPLFDTEYFASSSSEQGTMFRVLFALQQELDPIHKDSKNEHLHSTYADLTAVWAAIRQPLQEHGLLVIQEPAPWARGALVNTTLVHVESGEWRRSTTYIPARKADAQAFGSAITYARRYGLMTVLGLLTTDDDGHAASTAPPVPTTREEMGPAAPPMQPPARSPMQQQGTSDEESLKGWTAWSKKMMLQIQGCDSEIDLINLWTGMQPELKRAPIEIKHGLTHLKNMEKARWEEKAETGIDPAGDVTF